MHKSKWTRNAKRDVIRTRILNRNDRHQNPCGKVFGELSGKFHKIPFITGWDTLQIVTLFSIFPNGVKSGKLFRIHKIVIGLFIIRL